MTGSGAGSDLAVTGWISWKNAPLWRMALLWFLIVAAVCATRIPLAPKYLYYFDSVNFTLALDDFNPALHQPQPPGYPLQVLFTRGLHLLIPKPEHVFIAAGILTASLALGLLWQLGEAMFSARAGFAAALLLLLNPAFWLAGLSNQVRLWLAAGAAAVALACWRAVKASAPGPPFVAACALLGVLSGFRPAMLVFLLPLVAFTAWRSRPGFPAIVAGGTVLTATVSAWLGFTVQASGGWDAYVSLVRGYADHEFSPASALLGAPASPAWRMFRAAAVWNLLGALSWVWALTLIRRPEWDVRAVVLAIWIFPAFLFHSLVHVGDPDHTLITVAALCLIGGAAFAVLRERLTREGWLIANALAVAINAILFFLPMSGLPGASAFRAVEYVDRQTRDTFDAIRSLEREGPVTLACYNCFVTYRHLSYYLPEIPLLVLRQDFHSTPDPAAVWLFRNRRLDSPETRDGAVVLPPGHRVVWLLSPQDSAARQTLERSVDLRQAGPVYWTPAGSGELRFGGYRFIATPPPASLPPVTARPR